MKPRQPMIDETPLSPSEAAYLNRYHELWTAPNNTAMNASAATGLRESEQKNQEQPKKAYAC